MFKINIIILLILFLNNSILCSKINKEGDHIFAYFSDLVYKTNNKQFSKFEFIKIDGECEQWEIIVNENKIMIFKSKYTNNLVIAFQGSHYLKDFASDIDLKLISCYLLKSFNIGCGKIHFGFQDQFYFNQNTMLSIIKSLDQPYDIYFTGHSSGGAVALLASLFYAYQKDLKNIESINCITFGQPAVGDEEFNKLFLSIIKKINYRRYININNHNHPSSDFKNFPQDPVVEIMSIFDVYHPKISDSSIIYLNCKKHSCPSFTFGLHSSDLYMLNAYNHNYSQCNTNCKFVERNAKFLKFKEYHCMVKNECLFTGDFYPKGMLPDKYSVCLFTSRKQFKHYDFTFLISCNLGYYKHYKEPITMIDKTENKKSISKRITNIKELIVVVENHNTILGTSSFSYNISITNPSQPPKPPINVTTTIISKQNDFIKIQVNFTINNLNNNNKTKYDIYISNIEQNWKKYKTSIEPNLNKNYISEIIDNIPKGVYSIVIFSEYNGIQSPPSNIAFINCHKSK
ncbi:hypothetical protein ACTA71_006280 [Dictyostelium dimigraforme]